MQSRLAVVAVALLALPLSGAAQSGRPEPVSDTDSYAVYAAIASRPWLGSRAERPRRLAVSERTSYNPRCLPKGGPMETTWRGAVESFTRENASRRRILPGRDIGVAYDVLTPSQFSTHFTHADSLDAGWEGFHAAYKDAGGITTWSAVGFSADRRRALVYVNFTCGGLCAEGRYVFLEKTRGAWRAVDVPGVTTCVIVS